MNDLDTACAYTAGCIVWDGCNDRCGSDDDLLPKDTLMKGIRIDPVVVLVRGGYEEGVDLSKPLCEMTEHFEWSLIATLNDNGTARISGADGITLSAKSKIIEYLADNGVHTVYWRSKSGERSFSIRRSPVKQPVDQA